MLQTLENDDSIDMSSKIQQAQWIYDEACD